MPLKISHISKKYDDRWILRDVDFEARNGEITGIFGSTGAGKSTLIRLIAGSEKCSSGEIVHESHDVTALSCEDRQFHFPKLSNESFWKALFKTDKSSQLADGEGQVLALESAIEKADSVLLLDDSFCYMDLLLRMENYEKLKKAVREQNLIVLIATNDFDEAMLLCDRVAVLSSGEIKQFGTPREIYELPNSGQTAGICGRNNIFTARRVSSSKAETPEFQTLTGEHRLFTRKTGSRSALGALDQSVDLMIRPEHVTISFGASFPEDNLLKATIIDIKFLGATTLIRLDSNGLHLEALVLRLVGLEIGSECLLGLPPDRIFVLKD